MRHAAALILAALPQAAAAQGTGLVETGPLAAALAWLHDTSQGQAAISGAVIALAMVGFLMLTKRLDWRYGATVILGCFILFGATALASAIQSVAALGG